MSKVYLARCEEYDVEKITGLVEDAIEQLGGISALAPGKKVLLKPNLLMRRDPDRHTTTHPAVVEAVARALIRRGCIVTIADTPGGLLSQSILRALYRETGMAAVAERTGAKLDESAQSVDVTVENAAKSHVLSVLKSAAEADCIVSVGKIKTHGLTVYTGAVKNLFGLIPGTKKVDYHARYPEIEDFCAALMDIELWAKPVLSVLDGIIGMEGSGPSGGKPRRLGALAVSEDPHALDVVGAALIGMEAEEVPTLMAAQRLGRLNVPLVVGESVEDMRVEFERAPGDIKKILANPVLGKLLRSRPVVDKKKCVGCGICMRACPGQAIRIEEKKPVFDYGKCIRCFCCQELCPNTAIEVWQPFFMRWFR